jgi:Tol biopolymer transport system component
VELAPDGTRVAAVVRESTGVAGVWIYDLARSSKTRLNSAALYTGTIWSLDGTRVALGIKKDGSYDVVAKNADGAGTEELLFRSKADVIPGNWSSIGLTVTTRSPKTGWDVDYLPAGAGGTEHLPVAVLHGVANEMQGTLSPDGHWMLYLSDESGEGVQQAFLTEFPGGAIRRKVSTVEADMIRWNRNGKEFFLASRNKLMSVTIRSSAGKLEMDPPRTLFTMQADCAEIEVNCFDVSPDGNRFLVLEPVGPPPVVTLVQNWTAALKKQP